MDTSFKSLSLVYRSVYRYWEQVLRGRWRIIFLVAAISLAYEFHIWSIRQRDNLGEIEALFPILLNILILITLVVIIFGLLETRSRQTQIAHLYHLRSELRGQLMTVKDWDDIASILFRFIANHLSLNGLCLIAYNKISKKYEMVAKKSSTNIAETSILYLPLIYGGQKRAFLYLYMLPDIFYPASQIDMIRGLAPEIAFAIEHIDLLHSLTEKTQEIQKKEQDRIARHLHETIGQDLAYLCLKLDRLSSPGYLDGSVASHSEIESIHSVANKAYQQIRSLLSELRDEQHTLSSTDLISHIEECALLIGVRANFQVNIRTHGNPQILSTEMQRQILYLVREALRNIEKHAYAQNVNLLVNWINNGLSIKISDDGQGFDVSMGRNDGHYGLRIIQEIVDELKGSLFVESDQNLGTQITLWLPSS